MSNGFRIFSHIFVMVICAAAMAVYFMFPVWSVSVQYNVSATDVKQMLGSEFSDYDLDSAIPEEGIPLELTLKVDVPLLCNVVFTGEEQGVTNLIDANIDSIVDELMASIGAVTKTIVTVAITEAVIQEVESQVKTYIEQEASAGIDEYDISEILAKAGLSDRYLGEKINIIIAAIYSEGATVSSVTDLVINTIKEAYEDIAKSGISSLEGVYFDEKAENEVREYVTKLLNEFSDEDGNINITEKIYEYISAALDKEFAASTETDIETAPDEKIKAQLSSFLHDNIPTQLYTFIWMGAIALFAPLIISLFCWLYVFIKALVILIRGGDKVKIKAPIIFGWLPAVFFMFIPTFIYTLLGAISSEVFSTFTISFFSAGAFAAIGAAVLIIFSIVRRAVINFNK